MKSYLFWVIVNLALGVLNLSVAFDGANPIPDEVSAMLACANFFVAGLLAGAIAAEATQ